MKTRVLKVDPKKPDAATIALCASMLCDGGIVAFPTETVYGLAADARNERAIERIYEIKGRPREKSLTLHISDVSMIERSGCAVTPLARRLIGTFWPGPLTIILGSDSGEKVGFRMPDHAVARELITAVGSAVVAPSANKSGEPPATDAGEVIDVFDGVIDAVLDAGPTTIGVASTVVDATMRPPTVIREGAISAAKIEKIAKGS